MWRASLCVAIVLSVIMFIVSHKTQSSGHATRFFLSLEAVLLALLPLAGSNVTYLAIVGFAIAFVAWVILSLKNSNDKGFY